MRNSPCIVIVLLSDSKLCNAGTITLDVLAHEVVQKTAALTDHKEKTLTAVVVLLVNLQMLGELADALCENCNLNLRRACVGFVSAV